MPNNWLLANNKTRFKKNRCLFTYIQCRYWLFKVQSHQHTPLWCRCPVPSSSFDVLLQCHTCLLTFSSDGILLITLSSDYVTFYYVFDCAMNSCVIVHMRSPFFIMFWLCDEFMCYFPLEISGFWLCDEFTCYFPLEISVFLLCDELMCYCPSDISGFWLCDEFMCYCP